METRIVSKARIDAKKTVRTKWAKQIAMAEKLKPDQAVEISFKRSEYADKAREGINALVIRHNIKFRVQRRGNSVFITRRR